MTPGLHADLSEASYHADLDSLSHSGAKLLLQSPAKYAYRRTHPEHKDVFDFGSAAHRLVLGVGPKIRVVEADSWRTKVASEARGQARVDGEIPLLSKDNETVQAMADALTGHTLAMRLLLKGRAEVSAFCVDEATGVTRRARFDWLGEQILTDYKTTVCADPRVFERTSLAQYGYHMQGAWYLDIARDLGRDAQAFAFILQEKTPPYLVSVVDLDQESIQRGRDLNNRALRIYRDCTAAGVWPGYGTPDSHTTITLPAWAYRDEGDAA